MTTLRDLRTDDYPTVLELNEHFVHFLAPMDEAKLLAIVELTTWAKVVEIDGDVAAFAWAIPATGAYWSPFHAWFRERYDEFLYLDRVVVGEHAHRRGFGAMLYNDLERHARDGGHERVTLEVDIEPHNEGSLAFHTGRGYEPVGEVDCRPDGPLVRTFVKSVNQY